MRPMVQARHSDESGASLIEMVVTSLLVTLVGGLIFSAVLGMTRATAVAENVTFDSGFARNAMTLVSRDIRAAAAVLQSSAPAIQVARAQEVEFTANLETGPRPELIHVQVDSDARLLVTAITPDAGSTAPDLVFDPANARDRYITSFVVNTGPIFRYYDDRDVELVAADAAVGLTEAQREQVASIEIDLLVNQAPNLTGATRLTTTVRLPNA